MNIKIIGGIVAAAIIIGISVFGIPNYTTQITIPDQTVDVPPRVIIGETKPIGLVILSPEVSTTLPTLKQVYEQAASTGIDRSNVYLFWNILEPQKDQFNWENSDVLMSFNKQNDLQVTLFFSVVNGPSLGPFPDWMGRQALTEDLAQNTARVLDAILSRYDIVDNVIVGVEIDTHFRLNEGGIENYKHFFNVMYNNIKEKHPDVNFGSSFALHRIISMDLGNLVNELNMGDFVSFTYAPVDPLNEIVKTPQDARVDLERIFEFVPEKKVGLFEISWSTSDFVEGSEEDQTEFIKTSFDFFRDHESEIEFFTWYRQYDRPEGTCDPDKQKNLESLEIGGGSGIATSEFVIERLGYYICNAGLIDVNGNLKLSWTEFQKQIQQ